MPRPAPASLSRLRESRRQFLQQATAVGVGAWIAGPSLRGQERSANEQLNFACIGVLGKGSSDTDHVGQFGNVVALCDIDDTRLDKKAEKFPQARKFNDFREMLHDLDKQIDAVTVSTPDHTHAAASMLAMKLHKHVYTQKPLTWSVAEARALREACSENHVCSQMGNQGQAADGARTAIEIIRSGVLGDVHTVHAWTDRCGKWWKQAPDIVARPDDRLATPSTMHWDLFLGPAAERPYHPAYHPFKWRGWRDFGTGALGDMACHILNVPFWSLQLTAPTAISAESSELNPETYQQWATVSYEFPARAGRGPIKLTWWEGVKNGQRNLPPAELLHGMEFEDNGMLIVGSEGTLYCLNEGGDRRFLLPKEKFEGHMLPEPTLPRLGPGENDLNHKGEWVAAIRAGKPEMAMSNFDYAGRLTETVLLGNIAIRAGKKIEWDAESLRIPNARELEQYLQREYRAGWTL